MNIWFLTSEFPPEYGGGIGMYVDNVSKMMARAGHEITVFVRNNEEDLIEFPEENLRYIRFQHCKDDIYNYMGYWGALSYQYSEVVIQQCLKEDRRPDIIEVQEYGGIGYYLIMRKLLGDVRLKNIPIVVHLHTPVFELSRVNQTPQYKFPDYWIGQMEKFCIKSADAVVCPSEFLKKKIQPLFPDTDITVINLPYNLENINKYSSRNKGAKTIVYCGRTEYRKGILQALKAFSELWSEGYHVKLKVFGGDTYFYPKAMQLGDIIKGKYRKWIDAGLLELCGSIPPEELNHEILDSMAVLIPSIYENFPYTCVTSMWLGAPMIVSKQGGQAEMVTDEKNGFIFDWEKNNLKDKLLEVINMEEDQLHEIGENGKKRIYTLCNMQDNLRFREQYFKNVISLHKPREVFPFANDEIKKQPYTKENQIEPGMLSIIIPYYNLGNYLMETVESALKVTYEKREIIIINDGSTEEHSKKVLIEISKRYPEIIIKNIENKGLANARNVGANVAKGEFITFLDADDLVDPSFYEKSIKILQQYSNVSFVYCWLEYFENGSGIWTTFNTEFPLMLCANMLSAFCVVRKNDFINFGSNREIMEYGLEDYDGWLGLCENGYFGVSIPEPLVRYRVRTDSMSRQFNPDMRLYLCEQLVNGHKELYKKYGDEIFQLLLANGPSYKWNNPTFPMEI